MRNLLNRYDRVSRLSLQRKSPENIFVKGFCKFKMFNDAFGFVSLQLGSIWHVNYARINENFDRKFRSVSFRQKKFLETFSTRCKRDPPSKRLENDARHAAIRWQCRHGNGQRDRKPHEEIYFLKIFYYGQRWNQIQRGRNSESTLDSLEENWNAAEGARKIPPLPSLV